MKKLIAKIIAPWELVASWAHEYCDVPWSNLGWRVYSIGNRILMRATKHDCQEYFQLIDAAWSKQQLKYKKGR